jgi:hypothetical protein
VEQIAIVARLKPNAEQRARELIAQGAPFDLAESGLQRHTVYLAADTVVFVFEGHEVEWIVDRLIDKPFQWGVMGALEAWRPLVDGHPRIARAVHVWEASRDATPAASRSLTLRAAGNYCSEWAKQRMPGDLHVRHDARAQRTDRQ